MCIPWFCKGLVPLRAQVSELAGMIRSNRSQNKEREESKHT